MHLSSPRPNHRPCSSLLPLPYRTVVNALTLRGCARARAHQIRLQLAVLSVVDHRPRDRDGQRVFSRLSLAGGAGVQSQGMGVCRPLSFPPPRRRRRVAVPRSRVPFFPGPSVGFPKSSSFLGRGWYPGSPPRRRGAVVHGGVALTDAQQHGKVFIDVRHCVCFHCCVSTQTPLPHTTVTYFINQRLWDENKCAKSSCVRVGTVTYAVGSLNQDEADAALSLFLSLLLHLSLLPCLSASIFPCVACHTKAVTPSFLSESESWGSL